MPPWKRVNINQPSGMSPSYCRVLGDDLLVNYKKDFNLVDVIVCPHIFVKNPMLLKVRH